MKFPSKEAPRSHSSANTRAKLELMMNQTNAARPWDLLGLFTTGILGGALLGVLSNVVNGQVSPRYFVTIMHWQARDNIWAASITQGFFEGLVLGVVLSLIFTMVVTIASKARCPYRFGLRYLMRIWGGVLLFWLAGGLFAVCIAFLAPDLYGLVIIGVPSDVVERLKYAWVGGSITGAELGGIFCAIAGSVMFCSKWSQASLADTSRSPIKSA